MTYHLFLFHSCGHFPFCQRLSQTQAIHPKMSNAPAEIDWEK